MVFHCVLCESVNSEEYVFFSKFCSKCRKIKWYLNLYNERVYEILDNVLSRDEEKQDNKVKAEINKEIENKKYNLRKPKHIKRTQSEESVSKM
jgi:hypothetical protein